MNVAFININAIEGNIDDRELEFFNQKCSMELGSMYLQVNTNWRPEDKVININILKYRLESRDWKQDITTFLPDVIAISCLSYFADELTLVCRWLKGISQACVIVGGPHVTAVNKEILACKDIDFAIAGEGEAGFNSWLRWYRGEKVELQHIDGLIYRHDNEVQANPRGQVANLDDLQFPTLAQVNPEDYAQHTTLLNLKLKHMAIVTSRGCPYKCVYCHDIMGKNVRYRSTEHILAEIDYWHNQHGVDVFLIYDDIFNLNKKRLKAFFKATRNNPRLRFAFPNGLRADLLNEELVDILIDGGTFYAMVAIESGDETMQARIKKNLDLDTTFRMIEYMGKSGIILGAFNILGFPDETMDDIERTIQFNLSVSGLSKANFFVLNPQKGTEVYEMALNNGLSSSTNTSQGYFSANIASSTRHISMQQLHELRCNAYERFYLDKNRIQKILEQPPVNIDAEQKQLFHQVDYSYVLRQFIGMKTLSDIKESSVKTALEQLLPNNIMAAY